MSEEEKAKKPMTNTAKNETSSADDRKDPQEAEQTDKGTGGLHQASLAETKSAEPAKAENARPNADKLKNADEAADTDKDTRTFPIISQMQANVAELAKLESTEAEAGTSPEMSAEEAYFAQLEKDDTLVRKPKTLPIMEQPDLERSVRWGSVFLGKSAMLALRIKGRQEPIQVEINGRYVIGRVHPRSEERPDLDLNKYGAFFHGVSREHVAITKDGNLLQIEDLGSTNGTYLNGMKLFPHQPRMLRDGDELCLGHLVMRVHFLNLESDLIR